MTLTSPWDDCFKEKAEEEEEEEGVIDKQLENANQAYPRSVGHASSSRFVSVIAKWVLFCFFLTGLMANWTLIDRKKR